METKDFGYAIRNLLAGKMVTREGWNAQHRLGLQTPDENSANTLPYIYMIVGEDAANSQGKRVPWVASQADMLADDWSVIED